MPASLEYTPDPNFNKYRMRIDDSTYGSDVNGLIWGFVFRPGVQATPLNCEAAVALLAGNPDDCFVWLHFSLSNASTGQWLRSNLNLPDAFYESFHEGIGATRVEQEADSLVAVLQDVLFDTAFDAVDVATVNLSVQPQCLVSARLKPLRSVDRLRMSVKHGETFRSTADLLAHLLRDQAHVLSEIVRKSTVRVDKIEDGLLNRRLFVSRSEVGSLRRVLVRLQRLLVPEPAALFRLLNRPPAWVQEADLQDLRQSAEEFAAAVADTAALTERVKLIQEELAALINEQNNRSLFLLAVVTVLALPFNIIGGLFGMNVGGIPFSQDGRGFFVVVGLVSGVTAIVAYFALRRRD